MTTGLEVLDTVAKIGLGALISGVATYWVTNLNHDKELEKETIHRRRQLLEQVATGIEKFWNEFRRYYLVSIEATHRVREQHVLPSVDDEYQARRRRVLETTDDLGIAQSNLLLLGENIGDSLVALAHRTDAYLRATESLDTDVPFEELAGSLATRPPGED